MIRTISDFLDAWRQEREATLNVFNCLTDDALKQAIPGGRTLGRLANHIIETLSEMPHKMGLPVNEEYVVYRTAQDIIAAYEQATDDVAEAVNDTWTDYTLLQETNMYGEPWKNGFSLWILIAHQAHHRAQMTVLMRQAGLKVPGIYGPSKEEWEAMHMQPME